MSINNPKASPDGKIDGKEMVEKPPPRTYLELTQPFAPHRPFLDPVKSAFSCPVRPTFTPGRQIAPSVVTSSISTLSSAIAPLAMCNLQPVITKAVVRPVFSESQPVQTVVSTTVHRTSPLPVSAPTSSAPMASIIRGPTQTQTASSHLTHPAVQATYSSHVPRGAAAVASITTLKSSVASPMTRAPHVYAPSMISTQSSIQKLPTMGYHINSPGLQTRAPSLTTLRASVPTIPKTAPSLSTSEVSRSLSSSSSNLMPSAQLISISRPSDTLTRPTLIHSTANLPKPHSYAHHAPQAPEKGFYRPTAAPASVMPVQPTSTSTTVSTKPSISHHSAHLQPLPPSIHLASYSPITAHPSSISSHLPHLASIGTVTSSLSQSSLQHHAPFPKVIAQAIHTVAPIPLLQPSNIMSPAPIKPATSIPTIAVTTQSVPKPVASTGNTSASIPVAKVYPQPLAVTTRPSTEPSQHQNVARSAPTATLYVSAPQRMSAVVTTAASTSITLPISGSSTSVTSSNTISTEARLDRPVVPTPASYQFPTAMTCIYESLPGVSSTLTMHSISGAPAPRALTTMSVPTLRAGLSHQPASIALHSTSVRPSAGNINSMIVAMNPTRHSLTSTNTYSKATENLPASPSASTTVVASHGATLSYSGSPVQAANPPTNPPSSPRPSILRKRTIDGATVAVRKNLLTSMASTQPVSPRPDHGGSASSATIHTILPLKTANNLKEAPHENGQSSESTDSSCNGVPPLNVVIKQEPMDASESSTFAPTNFHVANRMASAPTEASPRKKPRKQQLTGNELVETHSTEGEDEFEKETREIVKKENQKEGILTADEDTERWISKSKRPPVTLLHGYRQTWKSRHNHFVRYTDIRPRDERHPTAVELANQKGVIQKANGWKVYHICSQIDDLVELESTVHSRLASLLEVMEKKAGTKEDEDLDQSRANELMRGNIQRCKLIRDQMNDARHQVLKVLDHKPRVVEIVGKFASKPGSKRK